MNPNQKIRKMKEEYKNKYNFGSWWFSSFDHQECANDIERIRKEIAKQIFAELDMLQCISNHVGSPSCKKRGSTNVIHIDDYLETRKKYMVD